MAALVVSLLYIALIELMLLESTETLRNAQRFRSRVVAQALAESGAELAARHMTSTVQTKVEAETAEGKMQAEYRMLPSPGTVVPFLITAEAVTSEVAPVKATVTVEGVLEAGDSVRIVRTLHSQ